MNNQFEISRVTAQNSSPVGNDRLSCWYDRLAASSKWPLAKLGLKKLKACTGETVLEIGFGNGNVLLSLTTVVGD